MNDAGSPRQEGLRSTGRAHALAGAAAAVLMACALPAHAQTPPTPEGTIEAGSDGLRPGGFYLEADSIAEDRANHQVIARGNVEARYQGRTLRAQEIVYNTETGLVTARGGAQVINADGTVQYADEIALDEDLRAGVATGFAARLEANGKLAAATAIRRSETVNELNRAIFTPCDICKEDGSPKTPSWDIRADKVVQDRDNNLVVYRNAVVRMFGVPVLYAPVFWHADPSAEAQSGFLMPNITLSDARGLSYEQPYLWVISPSEDLTVSPQVNTEVNPLLNLDWRRRFWSGSVEMRGGYTYEQDFDDEGNRFGEEEHRGYVLGSGRFAIDRNWRWGFAAEYASDDTFFDRYDISGVYQNRGLFLNDSRRLLSQVYTVRQSQRSYVSVAALAFQSLRFTSDETNFPGLRLPEDDDALPLVVPIIEARFEPEGEVMGGRLRLYGSAVAVERDERYLDPFDNPGGPLAPNPDGVDSRRASAELDWRRAFTTSGGIRFEPFFTARGDFYSLSDVEPTLDDETETRANVTGGVDVRYPLIRRSGETTIVFEPMAQFALSPESDLDPIVPNEDSLVLEIDETNLFRANRFPGYDLYEGGARLTVGAQSTWTWDGDREVRAFVGRTFRGDIEEALPGNSGFRERSSDWILAASATPIDGVHAWSRARIDDNGEIQRAEAAIDWSTDRTAGFARYLLDEADEFDPTRGRIEQMEAGGEALLLDRWGFTFRGTYDFRDDKWRRSEIGLLYQDECMRLELVYERNDTRVGELRPSDSIYLRLNLATLGGAASGRRSYDRR